MADVRFGDATVVIGDDRVAEVEFHRPPANYFDAELLAGGVEAIAWAAASGARAVVLCSEGRHFCAGLDFGATDRPEPAALSAHPHPGQQRHHPVPARQLRRGRQHAGGAAIGKGGMLDEQRAIQRHAPRLGGSGCAGEGGGQGKRGKQAERHRQ